MKFRANGNVPADVKAFNHDSLAIAWPKVIARAWLYQKEFSDNAALTEENRFAEITAPTTDDHWYADLLSQNPAKVKKVFIDEGLVTLASKSASDESNNWEQWITSDIYVVKSAKEIEITIPACEDVNGYNPEDSTNGWTDVKGLDHTVVYTLPESPEKDAEFALALADYCCAGKTYVFTG